MKAVILDQDTLAADDLDMSHLMEQIDQWEVYPTTLAHELTDRIVDADVVLSNKVKITGQAITSARNLKLIVAMATGTDHIDIAAAKQRAINVCNARDYSTASVAQHTFALILALSTRLLEYDKAVSNGDWQKNHFFCLLDYPIQELSGKTIGLIGYGNLAKKVEAMALAFDMKVVVAESSRPDAAPCQRDRIAFSELISQSDVISLHCPLTEQTRGLINKTTFDQMKSTSFIINTARGGVIDEADLVYALQQGKIAGAAIDVLGVEPPGPDSTLLQKGIPNLIVTPHSAWASRESRQRLVNQLGDIIAGFKQGRLINPVT